MGGGVEPVGGTGRGVGRGPHPTSAQVNETCTTQRTAPHLTSGARDLGPIDPTPQQGPKSEYGIPHPLDYHTIGSPLAGGGRHHCLLSLHQLPQPPPRDLPVRSLRWSPHRRQLPARPRLHACTPCDGGGGCVTSPTTYSPRSFVFNSRDLLYLKQDSGSRRNEIQRALVVIVLDLRKTPRLFSEHVFCGTQNSGLITDAYVVILEIACG